MRHRRLRDANRKAFQGGKNEGEREDGEGEGEGKGEETGIDTQMGISQRQRPNLARSRLQLPLSYQDNSGWYFNDLF